MLDLKTRTTLASAAAMFALASVAVAAPASAHSAEKVACYGVNACKGQSDCKSGDHACKGQNSCKGQGFKDLTAKQCAAEHGSTTAPQ